MSTFVYLTAAVPTSGENHPVRGHPRSRPGTDDFRSVGRANPEPHAPGATLRTERSGAQHGARGAWGSCFRSAGTVCTEATRRPTGRRGEGVRCAAGGAERPQGTGARGAAPVVAHRRGFLFPGKARHNPARGGVTPLCPDWAGEPVPGSVEGRRRQIRLKCPPLYRLPAPLSPLPVPL